MFPVEIWEEILQHSDPIDLVRFRRVCQSWCAIIPKLLEQPGIWYKKCKKDVPRSFWRLILEQKNYPVVNWLDFHSAENHPHVWKSLIRSFMNWRKLVDLSCETEILEPIPAHRPLERITCVAALSMTSSPFYTVKMTIRLCQPPKIGHTIAVGSSEGYVTIFDTSKNSASKIDRTVFLLDLKLWRNGADQLMVSTTSVNKEITHWNVQDRISETQTWGTLISAGSRYCYSVSKNKLTRVSASLTEKCQEIEDRARLDLISWDLPEFGQAVALCGDVHEVFLWSYADRLVKFCVSDDDAYCEISETNDPSMDVRHYQFFRPCIVSCIGELGEFGFSVAGRKWKTYSVFSKFHAAVTAVLFHIGVLVLGLESGEIHVFAVDNIFALENLNFDVLRSKRLILDSSPVICLKAREDESNHYVVAATSTRVHVVKFHSL